MSTLINSTSLGNLIITTGSVILLYVLIRIFAWDQITGIFEARAQKIADDIDGAEVARQKAEELAAKRETELSGARAEASQIIEDAKETGKVQETKIIAEAREEASRLKEKANQEIALSKSEALSSVKGEVADLTVLLAEKMIAKNLNPDSQSELIDSYLNKLGDA
ncbi:F0F1 ATP synthase subunit B [Streptococcus saliviloxodontae]|uniref:ATP synthase subunit b n=1 Tax=Streptococcus saliviloxodontae TaxID=1349416 RepID=A0ABS2PMB9_9STRE|nr:F0F1 ATP synthase subunit B [Streptococcus saliviloxodontae]MBM7636145.1 F-type H+-transporting ATPase subunit b [Streptococcus saliviloxodontae]